MDEKTKARLRASLIEAIGQWYEGESENGIDLPWVGDNTIAYIADAALSVVMALADSQEYIEHEGVMEKA